MSKLIRIWNWVKYGWTNEQCEATWQMRDPPCIKYCCKYGKGHDKAYGKDDWRSKHRDFYGGWGRVYRSHVLNVLDQAWASVGYNAEIGEILHLIQANLSKYGYKDLQELTNEQFMQVVESLYLDSLERIRKEHEKK